MISKKLASLTLSALVMLSSTGAFNSVDAACCYFAAKNKDINQPGQKAFINWDPKTKTEAFTVQPKFEGNAIDFGMVVPTPSRPKLNEMPRDFFKDLAIYTILMPLPQSIYLKPRMYPKSAMYRSRMGGRPSRVFKKKSRGVRVLESGVVGSLDYKIIVADNASGLYSWLKANKYAYAGDKKTLNFYIKKKWFFTVMKIDSKQMKKNPNGSYKGEVTPTRFTFSSGKCIYPLKITQISVKKNTDALFYVQAPRQMDLQGDWSWMHSYRPMYLTYMLGCGIDANQRQELNSRQNWLRKRRGNGRFLTTKLEWAKKLGDAEISVLENPKANYAQMGLGDLPKGSRKVSLDYFLEIARSEFKKSDNKLTKYEDDRLARMEDKYQPAKGSIVENKLDNSKGYRRFNNTRFTWYPNRKAPWKDVKGLTRLKGHLQKGKWLTKFRRVLSKNEMTDDMVLASVKNENQQTYVRIMPTSPP